MSAKHSRRERPATSVAGAPRQIRVLCTSPQPSEQRNPYVGLVAAAVSPDARTTFFTWREALLGRYDLIHTHWPESLGRARSRPRQIVKQVLTLAFLARIAVMRTPLVRTLHNLQPHEQARGAIDQFLVRSFDRLTTQWIVLNDVTPTPAPERTQLIPHGLYPADASDAEPDPSQLCFFGFIRPYKAVPELVRVFRELNRRDIRLTIMGEPLNETLASSIREAASGDERIDLDLRSVPENDLHKQIRSASLIVLPYREMHNSGAALLALSLGRPILVPRSPINESLSDEVGPGWIYQFDGELEGKHLADALDAVNSDSARAQSPDLSNRTWDAVGRQVLLSYRQALSR